MSKVTDRRKYRRRPVSLDATELQRVPIARRASNGGFRGLNPPYLLRVIRRRWKEYHLLKRPRREEEAKRAEKQGENA